LGLPEVAYVTEVARQVMKDKGYSRDTISSVRMQQDIMEAHYAREDLLDAMMCPIRICDRSAIDPIVYAILTANSDEEAKERQEFLTSPDAFRKALARYKAEGSVVILLKPVSEWLVDDGVRSTENQQVCTGIFSRLLNDLGIEYYEIGEKMMYLQERVSFVMGLGRF
jgi:nicotinamide riboside kinase